jgi:cytochrome c
MSSRIIKSIVFAALTFFIWSCGSGDKEIKRPRDPWVFRSVLDQQPRMVTVALHDDMYMAFDARHAGLYKAWKGGVILDGAVYTTKHGPQPTTKGYAYYENVMAKPEWQLVVNGLDILPRVQFNGYYFKEGQVTFKYTLDDRNGNIAQIEETPEYVKKGNKAGLHRKFVVSKLSDNTAVQLNTKLTSLENENDYESDGELIIKSKEKQSHRGGSTNTLHITLKLSADKPTNLKVFYHPGFDAGKTAEKKDTAPTDPLVLGAQLIEGSDCKTCHNEKIRTIGPSYLEVAEKYEYTEGNVKMLVGKVLQGGMGVWGEVMMNAHPDLSNEDAELMVRYIMSLDGEKPKAKEASTGADDVTLGMRSILFDLNDKNEFEQYVEGEEKPGLAALIYKIENWEISPYDIPKYSKPALTGVAPAIHFDNEQFVNVTGFEQYMYAEFRGQINIEEEGNYVFRIVSDDGSRLYINNKEIANNDGLHGAQARDGEIILKKGKHDIRLPYYQGAGGMFLSLQWAKYGDNKFSIIPNSVLSHKKDVFEKVAPFVPKAKLIRTVPGDQHALADVHPAFDLAQARPSWFEPKVGGMDFLSDGRMVLCTWDSVGPVYVLEGVSGNDPENIKVTKIASGLAEPLGLKVVNDTIYVLQKQELTRLIDHDGDGIIDEYQTVSDDWRVSANFHEFAFGLVYKDGYFYAALATAIDPGGASSSPQIPDRGKVVKISKKDGSVEFIAHGLRTPNGVGIGVDGEIFITDNQGDWLPSSKLVHVKPGAWYGSRSVDPVGTANLRETLPVVWLPQDEIGNSPSQVVPINVGPYTGQQLHGEVTHGGLKRVFVEKVNGEYQGALFRFTQGLEAGVNRAAWGPDGSLYIGGIGNPGNWGHYGKKWFGLQRITYNNKSVFEMLALRAKSNGIEIEFTEPIHERYGNAAQDYHVQQWYYKPTIDYGGPKLGLTNLNVQSVNISDDRKKVFLELSGMKPGHMIYVQLKGGMLSATGNSLWSTEAWYNMNQIPSNNPGLKNLAKRLAPNTLTEAEIADGWKLLFDGKTTNGWRNFKSDKIGPAWKVRNGELYLDTTNKKDWQVQGGGDIITENEYENFEFYMEWKIQNCGNSGIMFNVVEDDKYNYVWQTGPEMQILDNVCHPDASIETHRSGDLYDMIACRFVTVNQAGEWNKVRIISNKGKVQFWQNGYEVVNFTMHTPEWEEMIKNSKFKDMPDFGKAKKGHLSLQDHGDMVWFRNIRIRELN